MKKPPENNPEACTLPIIKQHVIVKSDMSIVVMCDKYGFQRIPTLPFPTQSSVGGASSGAGQISGSVLKRLSEV